jgi:hypothetical protein
MSEGKESLQTSAFSEKIKTLGSQKVGKGRKKDVKWF